VHLPKTVLIIDDEPDLCVLLKVYFQRRKYKVFFAHNLMDGEKLLNEIHPDVLLLDNNLPDGMGWNKLTEFNQEIFPSKVILMSGNPMLYPHITERYNVLTKPISFSDLDVLV
jgi:DNA-binding response OmpR family regulator